MKEEEIRPKKIFDELLRLSKEDIDIYFTDSEYKIISCPSCDKKGIFAFNKNSFNFDECEDCKTLYVSPRPVKIAFDNYYTDSESTKYWATTFYNATQKNRREILWKPKAQQISDKIKQYSHLTETIVDIGGGYGVFIEEFLKISSLEHFIIEPSKYLSSICREKNLKVIEKFLEDIECDDISETKKTFVSFELFEHLHEPKLFLDVLYKIMNKDDMFIFTTLNGMGVDIQTLWEDSNAISPPFHLNFFNTKSIEILLRKIGFKVVEITTPGKLDINIMENNIDQIKDRFWKNFIETSTQKEKDETQNFISNNLLSSHMMIVCKKEND